MDEVIPSLPFQAGLKKGDAGKKLQPRGLFGPEMHGPFGFELAPSKPFHRGAPDRQIPAISQKFVQGDSRVICHWPSTARE